MGGQLIRNRQHLSNNMAANQNIILNYQTQQETFKDGIGTLHTLVRAESLKVSLNRGKMYRPSRDCAMCKLTHRRFQTVFYCDACKVPLCSEKYRREQTTTSEKHCFINWHNRLFSTTRARVCREVYDLSTFQENEPKDIRT